MTAKSFIELKEEVRRLSAKREQILEEFLATDPIIVGTISRVRRKCGKPNCYCVEEASHETVHLKTRDAGRERCQYVRKADIDDVVSKVGRYRRLRDLENELDDLHRRTRDVLTVIRAHRAETYC